MNPSAKDSLDAQIAIRGARVKSATATVLTAPDIHARNTFEQREAVKPKSERLELKTQMPVFRFPAASVVKLTLELV